jgi:ribosomal subunit interface protein
LDIRVSGHQVDTDESLRESAVARLSDMADKYFARAIGANVTFGRGPNDNFTCAILAPVANGVVLKSSHQAAEAKAAFSGAADRIETQLRRYVKRLRDHKPAESDYVENAAYTIFSVPEIGGDDSDEAAGQHSPAIVAETRTDIPDASVSDAVMLMDLRNTNALMFRNSKSGEYNMVYRREDGTIGWVEPHQG